MNMCSGLFAGQTKYLWLSAMLPQIEIELAGAEAGIQGTLLS